MEGVNRIGELYRMEDELRGLSPEARLAGRQERSAPLIADTCLKGSRRPNAVIGSDASLTNLSFD